MIQKIRKNSIRRSTLTLIFEDLNAKTALTIINLIEQDNLVNEKLLVEFGEFNSYTDEVLPLLNKDKHPFLSIFCQLQPK